MKKLTLTLAMAAMAVLAGNNMKAQEAPTTGPFDFSSATNYYLIWLDGETAQQIPAADIKKDYRVDDADHALYIWEETYTSNPASGMNSNNASGGYIDLTVNSKGWAGMGFAGVATGRGKDMSELTDDYYLHFAVKTPEGNNLEHMVTTGGLDKAEAHIVLDGKPWIDGNSGAVYQPYVNFPRDEEWYSYDIPMSTLKTLGAQYTDAAYKGNVFALISGGTAGQNICLDAVFFYTKKNGQSISDVNANDIRVSVKDNAIEVEGCDEAINLFDISGKCVKSAESSVMNTTGIAKGVYILKAGNVTKKIAL